MSSPASTRKGATPPSSESRSPMANCSRCGAPAENNASICPACAAGEAEFTAAREVGSSAANPVPAESLLPPRAIDRPWRCPTCGEAIEAGFDVCWNCGTSSDGVPDPHFTREEDPFPDAPAGGAGSGESTGGDSTGADSTSPSSMRSTSAFGWTPPGESHQPTPFCPRCRSTDRTHGARLAVVGGVVQLAANDGPPAEGELLADICRDCGCVEWRVAGPARP